MQAAGGCSSLFAMSARRPPVKASVALAFNSVSCRWLDVGIADAAAAPRPLGHVDNHSTLSCNSAYNDQ